MDSLQIDHLQAGGIITNYSCSSTCRHCLYNCSPKREKDYLTPDLAKQIIKLIRTLGCTSVHIGGGEPFMMPEKLVLTAEAIQEAGGAIEYVETNCSWYRNDGQSEELLNRLLEKGVHTLLISISPFHNRSVPFNKTEQVLKICSRTGMGIFPWIRDCIRDLSVMDKNKTHTLDEFQAAFGDDYLERLTHRYWIRMNGRALETFRSILPLKTAEKTLEDNRGSCRQDLSDTSHFHIDCFGNYIPGLCSGFAIQLSDLGMPLDSGKYPLLNILADSGINGLWEWVSSRFNYQPCRSGYLNKCDLCTEIRSFLFNRKYSSVELQPPGFYKELPISG
jgi:hypothetical protein